MPSRRARGEGSVRKLPSGRWQAAISTTRGGGRHRVTKSFPTRLEAVNWHRAESARLRAAERPAEARKITLAQAVELHGATLDRQVDNGKIRPRTRAYYHYGLEQLPESWLDRPVASLTSAEISDWVASLSLSPSTRRGAFVSLHRMLKDLRRQGLLLDDPMVDLEPPAPTPQREVRHATRADVDAIIAHSEPPFAQWIRLVADTGLRLGELEALRWEDVEDSPEGRYASVRQSKTAAGRRAVPLSQAACDALDELPRGKPSDPILTVHKRTFALRFADAVEAAGLKNLTPHSLRHGVATRLLEAGVSPHLVSAILGHSSVNFTLGAYAHAVPAAVRDAMNVLDKNR